MTNNVSSDASNAYTNAPHLGRNFALDSLRLLFWLFFHPSAYRNHLRRIDSTLVPNFCLAELSWAQWQNGRLRQLLFMLLLPWPLLATLLLTLLLVLVNTSGESLIVGLLFGLTVGILSGLIAATVGSLPVGVAVGLSVTLVAGGASSVLLSPASFVSNLANGSADELFTAVIGLAAGLSGGLGFGVAAGTAGSMGSLSLSYPVIRQISGVIIGILLGLAAGVLASLTASSLLTALLAGLLLLAALYWRTNAIFYSLVAALLVGSLVLVGEWLALQPLLGLLGSILQLAAVTTSLFALPYILAERLAGAWSGALAGALGAGGGFFLFIMPAELGGSALLFALIGILLGLTLAWWRPILLYPFLLVWNILLWRLDERSLTNWRESLLRWHSAFWDEFQRLPLLNLDNHLLLVLERHPEEARRAIAFLRVSRQRWAARAAQIELDARLLSQCRTIEAIAEAHEAMAVGELAGPSSALLRSFSRISQDVAAARQQESAYNQRLALSAVEDRLDGLVRELTRSTEPYANRFQPIAAVWRRAVSRHHQTLIEEVELRQEIDNPYIIGVPLTEQQALFVGRTDISSRIEQLLLDRRRPPLLLYGQRRVGKTSLLNNLGRLLPSHIVPLFVDMQGPATAAKNDAGFLYNVARSMVRSAQRQRDLSLPKLSRDLLLDDPFTRFDEWLDEVEAALGESSALLMLDEFEVLERAFDRGRFDEEVVLGMFRHLIQHRPRFKVLLSGSNTLDQFGRWASYLINVQVVQIGYLKAAETRQLVTQPVPDFDLQYEPTAVNRVLSLTSGHPFLVQLLCAEIVSLKNEQPPARRRLATLEDVETAVPDAITHGSFFFADIKNQTSNLVAQELLRFLAGYPEGQAAPRAALVDFFPSLFALEEALKQLQERGFIQESEDGGYQFQVEMIRRWWAKQRTL